MKSCVIAENLHHVGHAHRLPSADVIGSWRAVAGQRQSLGQIVNVGRIALFQSAPPDDERVLPLVDLAHRRLDDVRGLRVEIVARPVDVRRAQEHDFKRLHHLRQPVDEAPRISGHEVGGVQSAVVVFVLGDCKSGIRVSGDRLSADDAAHACCAACLKYVHVDAHVRQDETERVIRHAANAPGTASAEVDGIGTVKIACEPSCVTVKRQAVRGRGNCLVGNAQRVQLGAQGAADEAERAEDDYLRLHNFPLRRL